MVSLSREREALILAHLDLVERLSHGTPDPEEFFSIGQLALVLAAGRHDLSLPQEAFRAYAAKSIRGAFKDEHRRRAAERTLRMGLRPQTVQPDFEYRVEDLSAATQNLLADDLVQASLGRKTSLPDRSARYRRRRVLQVVSQELCGRRT